MALGAGRRGETTLQALPKQASRLPQPLAIQGLAAGTDEYDLARLEEVEPFFRFGTDDPDQPAAEPLFDGTRPTDAGDRCAERAACERMRVELTHTGMLTRRNRAR